MFVELIGCRCSLCRFLDPFHEGFTIDDNDNDDPHVDSFLLYEL